MGYLRGMVQAQGAPLASYIRTPEWIVQTSSAITFFLVAASLFTLIYKIMPDIDLEWRDVVLGGLMTSVLFNTGKLVVGYYLGTTSLVSTYGAAGSLVVCLFWVYYSALVFFFGAEFTQVFANRYGSAPTLRVRRLLLGTLRPILPGIEASANR